MCSSKYGANNSKLWRVKEVKVMCLWNGPPILIGGEQKKDPNPDWSTTKSPPPPHQSILEKILLLFISSISILVGIVWPKWQECWRGFYFLLKIYHFWFKTRPIFCQTLWLRTFENYLLVESAFVARNSRTLFSKLYHPCFLKIHKFSTSPFSPVQGMVLCLNLIFAQTWF